MLDQVRQVQGEGPASLSRPTEEPVVTFLRRASRAASLVNRDLLEVRARLATLASPEPEERAVLHDLTLAQARVEMRRTVGQASREAAGMMVAAPAALAASVKASAAAAAQEALTAEPEAEKLAR
jgi:hypothetical protein